MRINKAVIDLLSLTFVSRDKNSTVGGNLKPDTTDTHDLGSPNRRYDNIYAKAVIADTLTGGVGTDHGALGGLGDDDHSQYVHISIARTITAQHSFSPGSAQAPFLLGTNAQDQTVVGLRADSLNKSVDSGNGLTGGGALTGNLTLTLGTPSTLSVSSSDGVTASSHTHAITSSSNPGAAASLLASDASGYLQLTRYGVGRTPTALLDIYNASGNAQVFIESLTDNAELYLKSGMDAGGELSALYFATALGNMWSVYMDSSDDFNIYDYNNTRNVFTIVASGGAMSLNPLGNVNMNPGTGSAVIENTAGGAGLYMRSTPGNSSIFLQSGRDGTPEVAEIRFDDGVAGAMWGLQKQASGQQQFTLYDYTKGGSALVVYPNGITEIQPGGDLWIDPVGDNMVMQPDVEINSSHYASQVTGWHVTYDGDADFRYIYADELHVKAFVADIYQAVVGGLIVTYSRARLSRDFTIPFADPITGVDGDVSGASIVVADATNDHFSISGDQTSLIGVDHKFTVAGSTANDGVYNVASVSYNSPNTEIYTDEDITSAVADGTITFHHYFSVDGDQTAHISAGHYYQIYGSTNNDRISKQVASVSYDSGDDETDVYPNDAVNERLNSLTADGWYGTSQWLYVEDIEGWEDVQAFAWGDLVRLRHIDTSGGGLIVTDIWGRVVSYVDETGGEQRHAFYGIDDGIVSQKGKTINTGAIALDYGTTSGNRGVWEATVLDAAGAPYDQVKTWASDGFPWESTDWTVNTRAGNLDGIGTFGEEYGFWAGDGTTVNDSYLVMSDTSAQINNITLKVTSSSIDRIVLNPTTPYLSVGTTAPTGYLSHAGLWVGYDVDKYKMHLGDPSTEHIRWTGLSLQIFSSANNYAHFSGNDLSFYSNSNQVIVLSGASGDVRFGLATAGNLLWDASASSLLIRHSTSTVMSFPASGNATISGTLAVTTPGSITAGTGAVVLDADGVTIDGGDDTINKLKFEESSVAVLTMYNVGGYAYLEAAGSATYKSFVIRSYASGATGHGDLFLRAQGGNYDVEIYLTGDDNLNYSRIGFDIDATEEVRISSSGLAVANGIYVGSVTGTPTDNDVTYQGNLVSGSYDVFAAHWYTTDFKSSTSWDGDSKSISTHTIDTSAVFGVPANVKAVYVRVGIQWASQSNSYYAILRPKSASSAACMVVRAHDTDNDGYGWVTCDSAGDIEMQMVGLAGNVWLQIYGYSI